MTIIEAIKSGKRFKRPPFKDWMGGPNGRWGHSHGLMAGTKQSVVNSVYQLCQDDLIADDWEIEEQKLELTKSKIIDAFSRVVPEVKYFCPTAINKIFEELGFK